jgi:pilus assembly protein Flp/PilA
MKKMMVVLKKMIADESGQDLIEYALVASLLGLVAVAALQPLGTKIATVFTTITTSLN